MLKNGFAAALMYLAVSRLALAHFRLCCTNPVRDSSREASKVAGRREQTDTLRPQDQELAGLQRGAQASWFADDLV